MSETPANDALRLTVTGAADLVVQLPAGDPSTADETIGDRLAGNLEVRGEVRPLPTSVDDRALGRSRFEVVVDGWRFEVAAEPARRARLREKAQRAAAAIQPLLRSTLRAQIPGRVTRVWVSVGQAVEQGDRLLAIEAMKMENEIRAPRAGRVEAIAVSEGGRVELNDRLLDIV